MADFGSIISDAFKFATPFAQTILGQSSTPKDVQSQQLRDASLNGSGPNDPTLAKQSPLGLLDFIRGTNSGVSSTGNDSSGLTAKTGLSGGMIAVAAVALVAVIMIMRK